MIVNSTIGTGLSGTLRYVKGQGRDENGRLKPTSEQSRAQLLGGTGFGFNPETPRQEEIARRLMEQNGRPDIQAIRSNKDYYAAKDVKHTSLSWAPGQQPKREEMLEAANKYLKDMGMEDSMSLIYQHTDKSHAHLHIVSSRVDPRTGRAYDNHQQFYRDMHWGIEYERNNGYIPKSRQWCHDWADATRGIPDHERLRGLFFENEATVSRKKLDMAFGMGGHFGAHLEAQREKFVQDQGLVRLKESYGKRVAAYTTREMWQEEQRLLAQAKRINANTGFKIQDKTIQDTIDEMKLSEEQAKVLRRSTQDNGLSLISGEAGTGKSHTSAAIRKAHEKDGYKVKGLAFTHKVTNDMRLEGFDADTIAHELHRLKSKDYKWDEKTAVMIDEAAQLSTKDLGHLLHYADKYKSKVIGVGHSRQLGAIKPGGMFPEMEKEFGSGKLKEIRRTPHEDQKKAWNHMANRQFRQAVNVFKKSGSIRWHENKEEAHKALTEEYIRDVKENPDRSRMIIAPTNEEVDRLNQFAREQLKEHGRIGPDTEIDTDRGKINVGVGDRMVVTENLKKYKKQGLSNGTFGTIQSVSQKDGKTQVGLQLDGSKEKPGKLFNLTLGEDKEKGEFKGLRHGYAGTTYKSQGSTKTDIYLAHDPRSTAPSNYVGMTRHIDRLKLYVSREDATGYEDLVKQLKHGQDKTAAHHYQPYNQEDWDRIKSYQPKRERERPTIEQEQDRGGWRNVVSRLMKEDKSRQIVQPREKTNISERQQGEAGRNLTDTTEATRPGLFIKRERKLEDRQHTR